MGARDLSSFRLVTIGFSFAIGLLQLDVICRKSLD
jgi:hypothetical protein